MRILITGACGFVGGVLARAFRDAAENVEIIGLDNLVRSGSETNRTALRQAGFHLFHGDIRLPSDLEFLPRCDWIIDAAANPSVLAGVDGKMSGRQLVEHNLVGTLNLLELCRKWNAGFIMLSTSRVYSIAALSAIPMETQGLRFVPKADADVPGFGAGGVRESFSTQPPLSLYGSSKLASEVMALEYGATFQFPVYVNRCGVLAGAGQFGKIDQGIFSFWIHSYRQRRPLTYIGFDGTGHQVRDCLHPRDLLPALRRQMTGDATGRVFNLSGGIENSVSLAELSEWCAERFGRHDIRRELGVRPFDIPWLVLDTQAAQTALDWRPNLNMYDIFSEIAAHAEQNPHWLDISNDV
jgi:CDP-paratose 2-epimerase